MFESVEKTPIQKLNMKINDNNIFMKRDDLIPFSFGGNKVRKALLFFKDLIDQEYDTVITYGSSSSNHCRIIANLAAQKGIRCLIISPLETNRVSYNSKMMELFGAQIVNCRLSKVKETIESIIKKTMDKGYNPYFIQGGGHGNIGTRAYIKAYEEIKEYELKTNTHFDYVFHSSGTGTTQAGLICGKIINNDERQIIGINIARKNPYGGQVVLESVNNYLESIGMGKY